MASLFGQLPGVHVNSLILRWADGTLTLAADTIAIDDTVCGLLQLEIIYLVLDRLFDRLQGVDNDMARETGLSGFQPQASDRTGDCLVHIC